MEPVTLVSPDGREYVATTPVELNDLTMGQGYITLEQSNNRKSKSKKNESKTEKNDKNEDSKDDAPASAVKDTGHTPATDAK